MPPIMRGLLPWERAWVAHYFSYFGSTWEQRVEFRSDLADAGFGADRGEIGMDEESSGDEYWHMWAFTHLPASRDALLAADRRAREIAEAHGARYDSWQVMRDLRTGGLRQR